MSELRDLTRVFRAFQATIQEMGKHIAGQEGNLEQLRHNIHELRNDIAKRYNFELEIQDIHEWMAKFDQDNKAVGEQLNSLQVSLAEHRREIGNRIRKYEDQDEITKP